MNDNEGRKSQMSIEPGTYKGRCIEDVTQPARLGRSSGGNEQIALAFELYSPDGDTLGTMDWIGTFAPGKTTDITLRALDACGWTGADPSDLTGITDNEVELVVQREADQNGVERTRIRWVNRPGAGRIEFKTKLGAQETKALGAQLKGQIAAMRAARGGRSGPAPSGVPF